MDMPTQLIEDVNNTTKKNIMWIFITCGNVPNENCNKLRTTTAIRTRQT